ncbi:MAG: prepilin peptidase [Desulfuromonas sp.]|nr:prepilin peptidase [Desulfuromonas sp.]
MGRFEIWFLFIAVAMLGAVIGSFLNVCIYRIPAGKSIAFPASHCPVCSAPLRWYHNVPVISFLLLRGKCAFCNAKISWRYPAVELLNAGLYVLAFWYFGFSPITLVLFLFLSALVVITFIDLDHQIIPDVISLPGIVVGFACSFALPWLTWLDSIYGILLGGGSLLVVAGVYEFLTKKEGMGGGDIKLLAMIGAFLGWKVILPVIFLSSLIGSLVGVPLMLLQKSDGQLAIPFGPFLATATIVWLFWGRSILQWYFSFFRV